jgi:hypothetical protein
MTGAAEAGGIDGIVTGRAPGATRQCGEQTGLDPGGFSPKILMRMRGLEPPPGCPDTDLNRARLPIPPHPRAKAKISQSRRLGPTARRGDASPGRSSATGVRARRAGRERTLARALLASGPVSAPLSSRGLGRRPLMAETRVRIPVAVLTPSKLAPGSLGPFVFLAHRPPGWLS